VTLVGQAVSPAKASKARLQCRIPGRLVLGENSAVFLTVVVDLLPFT
jgi:hypothetical protein